MEQVRGRLLVQACVQELAANGRRGHRQSRLEKSHVADQRRAPVARNLVSVQGEHFVEREELDAHYSASRRNTPAYRLWASLTIVLSLAVRRRARTGDTTITWPLVETSRGVSASIPTRSRRRLSRTRARLFPVRVSFFRMRGPPYGHDRISVRTGATANGGGGGVSRLRVARRRHERLELALEQLRERETRQIPVLRSDDLHADREPIRREPARGRGRREIRRPGVAGPEQMVGHRHALAVDRQLAIVALTFLVVGKSRGAGHGAQQQVVPREELGPREPHAVSRLVRGEPVAMGQHGSTRGARVVALISRRKPPRDRHVLVEVRVALAVRRGRAQELYIDAERLARVDGRARALVDLRLLPTQEVSQRLEPSLHCAIHGNLRCVEHQSHLEVAQTLLPRGPQA